MSETPRKIIHVDMDAFYTSVEQRERPELRGKPVVVGGDPNGRGVVASASYEARRFGVRSAMSSRRAAKLCPQAIFVRPHFPLYKAVSKQIRAIFLDTTDLVEPLSLDEAYLDVTTNKLGEVSGTRVAEYIRRRIRSELHLTASAGVAPNKFLAKVASDFRKPDGLTVIPPAKVDAFVRTLPVERLWGVGPVTAEKLHAMGIKMAADLRSRSKLEMEKAFGKFGHFLVDLSFGIDHRPVSNEFDPKSRGAETTFEDDETSIPFLTRTVEELSEEVGESLVKIGRQGKTVVLKVKYDDFQLITRSRTLEEFTSDKTVIARVARDLFSVTEIGRRPVRLLGVSVSNFPAPNDPQQLTLLPDAE